jgi:hypothetical protein
VPVSAADRILFIVVISGILMLNASVIIIYNTPFQQVREKTLCLKWIGLVLKGQALILELIVTPGMAGVSLS